MRSLKSPITWFTLAGMLIGYFGIPVAVPGYTMWTWARPYGFHVASVLIFGSVGCLVGLLIHNWIWKDTQRNSVLWTLAVASLVLSFGIIGVFRDQAYNETVMWGYVNSGLVKAMAAARSGTTNLDRGFDLTQAGDQLQAGETMGGPQVFGQSDQKLNSVAMAFTQAGFFLISHENKEKLAESIHFVSECGAIIRQMGNQSYPVRTNHFTRIIELLYKVIPADYGVS
ncbi:MAG: hypothetical protein OWU32_14075 [Firmicutes bacterium]|nr:hypothetical protein [Bacillota bacterium]